MEKKDVICFFQISRYVLVICSFCKPVLQYQLVRITLLVQKLEQLLRSAPQAPHPALLNFQHQEGLVSSDELFTSFQHQELSSLNISFYQVNSLKVHFPAKGIKAERPNFHAILFFEWCDMIPAMHVCCYEHEPVLVPDCCSMRV